RSGVAVSCGVGCRRGSDPTLLWLWCRPVATAPIQPLAWEPSYAAGAAQEIATTTTTKDKKTKDKEKKRKKESNPIYNCIKKIKYLRLNLTTEVKDLYSENCKTLIKETEDNTHKWKDILWPSAGKINIVKMSTLSKEIYRFSTIPIKIPMAEFLSWLNRNESTNIHEDTGLIPGLNQ
uniref:Uncharacterized protein n=1 Tax=Sus scrofa TaxID=9823 RepID=A0A8D0RM76_PIG